MADVTKAGMFVTCVLVVVGCGRSPKPKVDLGSATADGPSAAELDTSCVIPAPLEDWDLYEAYAYQRSLP